MSPSFQFKHRYNSPDLIHDIFCSFIVFLFSYFSWFSNWFLNFFNFIYKCNFKLDGAKWGVYNRHIWKSHQWDRIFQTIQSYNRKRPTNIDINNIYKMKTMNFSFPLRFSQFTFNTFNTSLRTPRRLGRSLLSLSFSLCPVKCDPAFYAISHQVTNCYEIQYERKQIHSH